VINRRELLCSVGAASLLPAVALSTAADRPASPGFIAALHLGPAQDGAGNQRWADIAGGTVDGDVLRGRVQSGRLEWLSDPASGAVSVAITCSILRADGSTVELRDRNVAARPAQLAGVSGLPTAPRLTDDSGRPLEGTASLAGWLETDFSRGVAQLRAVNLR
jgi:hypothetical protein